MITRLISMAGAFASLCALIIMVRPDDVKLSCGQGVILGIAICFFVAGILLELWDWHKNKVIRLKKDSAIQKYMYKWISQDGRTVIFSRNLSWVVNNERMESLLLSKANANELIICLPQRIPLLERLEQAGAEICIYPELDYVPEASFTIVRQGRMDSRVAVGRQIKGRHVIEEFGTGEHPVFHVANDLTQVIIRLSHSRSHEAGS